MRKIHMVDTVGQYLQIKEEIDSEIIEILNSGRYIGGPKVDAFKNNLANYLGVNHVIPCANGTDALQLALMALGLQPGDEVITPSFTYIATAEVIALLRLKPVFVDVLPDTFNIDPSKLEAAISPKTKAIIPVHLFGQSANMDAILSIATIHNIAIVEDNAQAIGASYAFEDGPRTTGTIGDIGTCSFYPSKNLGAFGDAGAVFTNNEQLAGIIQKIANHGQSKRYYHDLVGVNSRLDAIQAAVLNVKLKRLDQYTNHRVNVADWYDQRMAHISGVEAPFRDPKAKHVFHQYTLKIKAGAEKRNEIQSKLAENGIPSMIYYPVSIHQQKAYSSYFDQNTKLPISETLSQQVLSLPIHSELTQDSVDYISDHLKNLI